MSEAERNRTRERAREKAGEVIERVRDLMDDLESRDDERANAACQSLSRLYRAAMADERLEMLSPQGEHAHADPVGISAARQVQRLNREMREHSVDGDVAVRSALISALSHGGNFARMAPIVAATMRSKLGESIPDDTAVIELAVAQDRSRAKHLVDQLDEESLRDSFGLYALERTADVVRRRFASRAANHAQLLATVEDAELIEAAVATVRQGGRPSRGSGKLTSKDELIARLLAKMGMKVGPKAVEKARAKKTTQAQNAPAKTPTSK